MICQLKACQVFEDGTIERSEFTVQLSQNKQCVSATPESVRPDYGAVDKLTLSSVVEGTYTLFLTNESFCDINASRITQNFNLTGERIFLFSL